VKISARSLNILSKNEENIMKGVNFQEALEIIESFPEDQQESLIDIVKHRLLEERRNQLARSIEEAREELRKGEVKKGTVDDLMSELSE